MTDFHNVLEQQFAGIDRSDRGQRDAVYAQARAALTRTIAEEPDRADLHNYMSDLEQAIADMERKYTHADVPADQAGEETQPRSKRRGTIAAATVALAALVVAGLWLSGTFPSLQRSTVEPEVKRAEAPAGSDPKQQLASLGFADPEQAGNAAFRDGDVRVLNLAIDSGFKLDTTQFPDAYLILMMQPSKGLANPEFRTALRRLKDDIRSSICTNVTLSTVVPVRDMIQQIGIGEYRFYCGANRPAFKELRGELSTEWQTSCRSQVPAEELAQKKALDHECSYDGFDGAEKITWESATTTATFKRLARIRDAIVELERQFQP